MDIDPPRLSLSLSPVLQPTNPQSNADLARLLALSYADIDDLRAQLALARKRADKADRLAKHLAPTDQHDLRIKQIVDDYEQKLARAEAERDDADARRREALEGWRQLDDLLSTLELHTRDARFIARAYLPDGAASMGPPAGGAGRQHARHLSASGSARGSVAFPLALPPHPNPNPTSTHPAPTAPARRPRTPSMDSAYPPSKRSRGLDDQRGRPPTSSYSDSVSFLHFPTIVIPDHQADLAPYFFFPDVRVRGTDGDTAGGCRPISMQYVASAGQQQEYSDQIRMRQQQQQAMLQRRAGGASMPEARIIDRKYGQPHGGSTPHHRAASPGGGGAGHSRSGSHSSSSSMDVDEMLIKATTGDEGVGSTNTNGNSNSNSNGNGTPNGAGRGYLDSPHHNPHAHHHSNAHAHAQGGLRRRDRENEDSSPRPYANSGNSGYAGPGYTSSGQPLRASGTLQQASAQNQANHVNHIFAPVVTGAPTKKTKFPNTPLGSAAILAGSTQSIEASSALSSAAAAPTAPAPTAQPAAPAAVPAAVPYPPTNADGQRICRQCGIVGRYKDGKCVEKWGPGPMGPGTVCDRLRVIG
ncbi:hypothetical protein JR316_0005451 [Psilocybe cubensis]|uniref:Uncharacterized protein n=1 Tax=Psilocybe cubensis TaxID=181762 RepID=A0ACB8H6J8_PSICU|nr:hypothetical protein JR316_0005451 [Psilocybe cubensis]KAH9483345.1 hypothetical protein JR316_0005451 [Psilocybe cubensis]